MASTNNRNKHLNAFRAGVEKSVNNAKQKTADITPYILGHTGPQKGNLEKIKAAGKGLFIDKPQFTKEESHLLNKFAQAFDAHSRAIKKQNPNNYTLHQTNLIKDAHLKAHMLGAFIEHALGTQNPVGRSLLLKLKPQYITKVGDDVTIKGGFGSESPQPLVEAPSAPSAPPAPAEISPAQTDELAKDAVRPEVVPGVQSSTIDSTKPESEEAQEEDKTIADKSPQGSENPAVVDKGTGDVTLGEGFEPIPPMSKTMQIEETASGQPERPVTAPETVDPLKGPPVQQKAKKPKPRAETLADIPVMPLGEEEPRVFGYVDNLVQEFDPQKKPLNLEEFKGILDVLQADNKLRKENFPTILNKLLAKMTEADQQAVRDELQQRGLI